MTRFIVTLFATAASSLASAADDPICKPQNPNEVRVERNDFGQGIIVVNIHTPNVSELLSYDKDGKTLLSRQIETTLANNEKERVTQTIFIDGNVVSMTCLTHANKVTQLLTKKYFSTKGVLLYVQESSSGKPDVFRNANGEMINEKQVVRLSTEKAMQHIDLDKVPVVKE